MNDQQLLRYSRQILLPDMDELSQQRLLDSRVLIVGLGGLGSPVALYLAAAGVGHLVLVDFDEVDLSNLQRQIIHKEVSIGMFKVDSAAQALHALNSQCRVDVIHQRLTEEALASNIKQVDLVLDCTDNFSTRFMLNRICKKQQKPLVSGAAIGMEGQLSVFGGRSADACYRCLYDESGDDDVTCTNNGVLAPVVGVIGSMQALEAVKILAQTGQSLTNQLLVFDASNAQWRSLKLNQDPACPICYP